jgi:hypothetical protein
MGEIKSTLDLVMEKTKHFSLSSEERELQKRNELKKRIMGLVQKYEDELLTAEQVRIDYEKLKVEFKISENTVLIEAIFKQLEINHDNRLMIDLLQQGCDLDVSPIRSIIDDLRQALYRAADDRQAQLKKTLAREHFISGSAVVPNLEADADWQQQQGKIQAEFADRLGQEKRRLGLER